VDKRSTNGETPLSPSDTESSVICHETTADAEELAKSDMETDAITRTAIVRRRQRQYLSDN
jgi:hypothetical protein